MDIMYRIKVTLYVSGLIMIVVYGCALWNMRRKARREKEKLDRPWTTKIDTGPPLSLETLKAGIDRIKKRGTGPMRR